MAPVRRIERADPAVVIASGAQGRTTMSWGRTASSRTRATIWASFSALSTTVHDPRSLLPLLERAE